MNKVDSDIIIEQDIINRSSQFPFIVFVVSSCKDVPYHMHELFLVNGKAEINVNGENFRSKRMISF